MINRISATTNFTGSPMQPVDKGLAALQSELRSLIRELEGMKIQPWSPERSAYIGNLEQQIEKLQNQILNKKTSHAMQTMNK